MTVNPISKARKLHSAEERRLLLTALKRNDWNVAATARELDMWVTSLRRAIVAHGLDKQLDEHGRGAGRPRKET